MAGACLLRPKGGRALMWEKKQKELRVHARSSAAPAKLPTWAELQAILLDVDGTLCDSDQLHWRAFQEQLQAHGVFNGEALSWPFFKEHMSGRHNSLLFQWLYSNKTQAEQEQLAEAKEARFRELLSAAGLEPMHGLQAFLDKATRHGIAVSCVTNAPRENVEAMLDALSAAGVSYPLKQSLVVANELSEPKPSGVPYEHACQDVCNASPEYAIAFEDSAGGIQSANNAQIAAVVGMRTSQDADSLLDAGATLSARDFADETLLHLLEGSENA